MFPNSSTEFQKLHIFVATRRRKMELLQVVPRSRATSAVKCKICIDEGDLIQSPCKCTGSVGLVHATCLETWLSSSNTRECELCKHDIDVYLRNRTFSEVCNKLHNESKGFYYIFSPFFQWIQGLKGQDRLFCYLLFTLLLLFAFVIFIVFHFYSEKPSGILLVLAFLILVVYVIWAYQEFKDWQKENQEVKLAI
mgnify:CR=1 FL=1